MAKLETIYIGKGPGELVEGIKPGKPNEGSSVEGVKPEKPSEGRYRWYQSLYPARSVPMRTSSP